MPARLCNYHLPYYGLVIGPGVNYLITISIFNYTRTRSPTLGRGAEETTTPGRPCPARSRRALRQEKRREALLRPPEKLPAPRPVRAARRSALCPPARPARRSALRPPACPARRAMTDRYTIHSQLEHLQSKYIGTGHADTTKWEWLVNQHRDSYCSYMGHFDLLNYFAIAENESKARVRFNLMEKMLQPCGPPADKPDES